MLISLATIKTHLRLDTEADSDTDAYLEGLYDAAADYCEKYLGQALPTDSDGLNSSVRAAMLLIIGDLYENREGQVVGQSFSENETVTNLLHFHRTGLGI
jgi:hypothetical protein